ncbi:MAG: hypothetical protein ABIJ37_06950 [Pseudomonadota bacterium]
MGFGDVISRFFPKTYTEKDFMEKTYSILGKEGFNADNTIASANVCRDEISQTIVNLIRERWGEAFNLSSLAGMFFAGRTALIAGMHHAPIEAGKERYVYYALPHIAIGSSGEMGVCKRKGREKEGNACGALNAFQKEIAEGRVNFSMDNEDIEQSLLRMRLLRELPYGHVPDLLELTRIAHRVIRTDIDNALNNIVDKERCDYALITGIQIHGPDNNYVWPDFSYAIINGTRQEITF